MARFGKAKVASVLAAVAVAGGLALVPTAVAGTSVTHDASKMWYCAGGQAWPCEQIECNGGSCRATGQYTTGPNGPIRIFF